MLKKYKILKLLFLLIFSGSLQAIKPASTKTAVVKNFLMPACGALAIGCAVSQVFKHWVYFEPKASFDQNTTSLLAKINDKYGWQFARLEDYNYQNEAIKKQIDQDLASDIVDQYEIALYAMQFKEWQAELDARLDRLTSWSKTKYLYDRWHNELEEVSMNMYNLQLWLEQVGLLTN